MLYRLTPHNHVTWCDLPARTVLESAAKHGVDLARLPWEPTEDRQFSQDLLRLALRHGVACSTGIVLDAVHTVDLGRADQLRILRMQADEAQAKVDESSGALMEQLMPGWTAHGEELDERIRESSERTAREAEEDLAAELAAPVKPELIELWTRLGGQLPS
jgi:hypothetical protein